MVRDRKISVIIPAPKVEDCQIAIRALKKVNYPQNKIEVLIALGKSPSIQRNKAAKFAQGSILYFLDNDSEISPQAFKICSSAFLGKNIGRSAPKRAFSLLPQNICLMIEKLFFSGQKPTLPIAAVGGPSIWKRRETFWESVAGIIFESFFAYFVMTSRFRPTGNFRFTNERELILCNLAVKKNLFLRTKGFREDLYPNEENEFLNRLTKLNYGVVYHPGIFVYRPRRNSLYQILLMFFRYGRGRIENIVSSKSLSSSIYFLPVLLILYLLTLSIYHPLWAFLLLFGYLLLGMISAIGFATRRKKPLLGLFLPLLFLLVHISYGLGILLGKIGHIKKRSIDSEVEIIRVKRFNNFWKI